MVKVRYSETYDLSTQVDKMGIIGIHTPSTESITALWKGLWDSHRFVRVESCDIRLACASVLPADPLQIGVESGDIAPQDMFNPLLYKAVSNDSFNTLQNRIYGYTGIATPLGSVAVATSGMNEQAVAPSGNNDDWELYYALLGDTDGWRRSMPQSGLEMSGLYPIVYTVVQNFGNQYQLPGFMDSNNPLNPGDSATPVLEQGTATTQIITHNSEGVVTFKGPSMRMPRIPTKAISTTATEESTQFNRVIVDNNVPTTYVACIITPPAKLHKLYYRMRITWTIDFEEVRPSTDVANFGAIATVGTKLYATDYLAQSSKMTKKTNTVDVDKADVDLVMVSGR